MRIELIHPAMIHFPIALLLIGSGLRAVCFFTRKSNFYRMLLFASRLVLAIGICSAWAAVLAGEAASDIVKKTLCQPQVLQTHSTLAYTASILFSAGYLFDCAREWKKLASYNRLLMLLSALLLVVATLALISVGFFGGSLVYDQGAAVEKCCR